MYKLDVCIYTYVRICIMCIYIYIYNNHDNNRDNNKNNTIASYCRM